MGRADSSGGDGGLAESLAGRSPEPSLEYRLGGSEVVLEGFLQARRRGSSVGSVFRALGAGDWFDCVRAVPWSTPWLALHVLRRLYRELA